MRPGRVTRNSQIRIRGDGRAGRGDDNILGANGSDLCESVVVVVRIEQPQRLLARVLIDAVLRVGAEPRVRPCAADVHVLASPHDHGPRLVAPVRIAAAARVRWIAWEDANSAVEWGGRLGRRLVVRRFGLQERGEYVARLVEVVLVEDAVLGRCPVQPCGFLALDQHAAGAVDRVLLQVVVRIRKVGVVDHVV